MSNQKLWIIQIYWFVLLQNMLLNCLALESAEAWNLSGCWVV